MELFFLEYFFFGIILCPINVVGNVKHYMEVKEEISLYSEDFRAFGVIWAIKVFIPRVEENIANFNDRNVCMCLFAEGDFTKEYNYKQILIKNIFHYNLKISIGQLVLNLILSCCIELIHLKALEV